MKKLIGLPLVGILMAGLLSLVSPPAANASCTGPYTAGCNPTQPVFNLPPTVNLGSFLNFRFIVDNTAGNRDPVGFVFFTIWRLGGSGRAEAGTAEKAQTVFWKKRVKYQGDAIRVKTPKFNKPGKYKMVAKFKAPGKKPFKTSQSAETFRVTR
jgi:hypothetical protein